MMLAVVAPVMVAGGILSAAHHLLESGAITTPYNQTFNTMPVGERREWSRRCTGSSGRLLTQANTG